jgi:hypothetical protein
MEPKPIVDAPGLLHEAGDAGAGRAGHRAAAIAFPAKYDPPRHAEKDLQRMGGVVLLTDVPLALSLVGGESWREPGKDLREIVRVPAVACIVVQIGQNRALQGWPTPGFVAGEDKVGHRPPARSDVRLPAPPGGANCCRA